MSRRRRGKDQGADRRGGDKEKGESQASAYQEQDESWKEANASN